MVELLIQIVVLIGLFIGSYTDFKSREVPDWVNFSLIAIGFAIGTLASSIYGTWAYLLNSIFGFLLCLAIALLMFHTGQWGGGDSKMIMGLGALIGLNIFNIDYKGYSLISFFVNVLIAGAFYGIFWSVILSIKNGKKFRHEIKKRMSGKKLYSLFNVFFVIALVILTYIIIATKNILLKINMFMIVMLIILYYLWHLVKIVEKVCMYKYVSPRELTEGDWIARNVKINGKNICGPKDLGITKKQISQLINYAKIGKIKKILIKEGIPFVPSFLVAYILTILYGNVLLIFL
ncbi:MAG: prepilin peptidase [Nanoarchaeota archaeon]